MVTDTPVGPTVTPTSPLSTPTGVLCRGDCEGEGRVTLDELLKAVRISLGEVALQECASVDSDGNDSVSVDELVQAVASLLKECR